MNLRSLFIREHDGSACSGGYCRHDKRYSDSHCPGHPSRNEAGYEAAMVQSDGGASIDTEPESWAVICGVVGWVALIFAVVAAAAAIAAFSEWSPPYWPRIVVALNFWS
jgi:hypothetical protein